MLPVCPGLHIHISWMLSNLVSLNVGPFLKYAIYISSLIISFKRSIRPIVGVLTFLSNIGKVRSGSQAAGKCHVDLLIHNTGGCSR